MSGQLELELEQLAAIRDADAAQGYRVGSLAEVSTAISLKRIADVLTGQMDGAGFANLEQVAWSMGRSFEQGRRTDR